MERGLIDTAPHASRGSGTGSPKQKLSICLFHYINLSDVKRHKERKSSKYTNPRTSRGSGRGSPEKNCIYS